MASSNRHWPSMFKSKPTNTVHHHHHQWQHDLNHRNPYTPTPERTPEPKPRWSPKPEQIRILEAIFNSGIINPPRDEIRRIRVQLQAYGQIGDANVFYWFQNRKSRNKHKHHRQPPNKPPPSDKPSPHNNSNPEKALPPPTTTRVIDLLRSRCNNNNNNNNNSSSSSSVFLEPAVEFSTEPSSLFFTGQQQSNAGSISTSIGLTHQGFCFPDHVDDDENEMRMKMQQQHHSIFSPPPNVNSPPTNYHVFEGVGLGELNPTPTPKTSVFINDVCFEVEMGPINVRETFGDDVVLLHSWGQPVPTNEWGLTQQPLQNGEFYYLLRPFTPSPDDHHDKTIHLI